MFFLFEDIVKGAGIFPLHFGVNKRGAEHIFLVEYIGLNYENFEVVNLLELYNESY